VLLHLVCAKADRVDPNQMHGLLSLFTVFFDVNFYRCCMLRDSKSMLGFARQWPAFWVLCGRLFIF
jgi:hypothetical protein